MRAGGVVVLGARSPLVIAKPANGISIAPPISVRSELTIGGRFYHEGATRPIYRNTQIFDASGGAGRRASRASRCLTLKYNGAIELLSV